jgi:hypothetical protein
MLVQRSSACQEGKIIVLVQVLQMKMSKFLLAGAVTLGLMASAGSAAQAAEYFNFSWTDGLGDSATGQLVTDGATQITDITGVQTVGAATSAITGISNWADADNQFFDPAVGGSYFSFGGASYTTLTLGQWNLFAWNNTNNALSFNVDNVGYPQNGHPITFRVGSGGETSGAAGAIPEPAAWTLMILGFGGAGAMLRRRRMIAA